MADQAISKQIIAAKQDLSGWEVKYFVGEDVHFTSDGGHPSHQLTWEQMLHSICSVDHYEAHKNRMMIQLALAAAESMKVGRVCLRRGVGNQGGKDQWAACLRTMIGEALRFETPRMEELLAEGSYEEAKERAEKLRQELVASGWTIVRGPDPCEA